MNPSPLSFFGLQLWFPEFFDRLMGDNCNTTTAEWTNCSDEYYQSSLFIAVSTLPGHVAGLMLITVLGGRIQLGTCMHAWTMARVYRRREHATSSTENC